MLIRIPPEFPIRSSEIAPERLWLSRRQFVTALGLSGIGLAAPASALTQPPVPADAPPELAIASRSAQAGDEKPNSWEDITQYNNYYEFGTDKTTPAEASKTLKPRPWTLTVDGECEAPGTVDIDALIRGAAIEERIYRHRCVEAWSIVVPWAGVPLGAFLKRFKPTSKAKYVSFVTLWDRRQMPLTERRTLPWPYREGLRIDEAMHPLAFLTLGVYGRLLPNQNGAPVRLTIPWKYGFKGIKSIVRIQFTETQPQSTWNLVGPDEYGFYANVNPAVDHPRWSQASERRLGEFRKRATLPFNGYPEVASLYAGMDLRRFY